MGRLARVCLLGLGERRTKLLDRELGEPLAHVDGLLEGLALDDTGDETTGESITTIVLEMLTFDGLDEYLPGTVGVVDLVLADGVDRDLLHVNLTALLCGDSDCRVGTLCDNDCPGPLCVLLGAVGDSLGDLLDVLSVKVVGLSEGSGLGLIADEDVDVRKDLIERILEELRNEGSGKVENERLRSLSNYASFDCSQERTLFLAAASSARALMAGTQTVKWKPPT